MPQLTTLLIQNGVPEHVLVWMFMLPIAITLAVIGRQIIGIKGFSITAPILIGFAFAATGLQSGLIIFFSVLGTGFLVKSALDNIRILYLPKMALILLGISVAISVLIAFIPNKDDVQFSYTAFSLIILILSAEQFTSSLMERGPKKTLGVALETLAVSVAIFFLVTWGWLVNTVINYPLFVLIASALANLFLGKWTGLRLSEYIRFKDIIFR
ncbi:MAG: 7TM domain-containing protein [Candidatus Spechtbacterales bacterium]